jgi:hypothetical protein
MTSTNAYVEHPVRTPLFGGSTAMRVTLELNISAFRAAFGFLGAVLQGGVGL